MPASFEAVRIRSVRSAASKPSSSRNGTSTSRARRSTRSRRAAVSGGSCSGMGLPQKAKTSRVERATARPSGRDRVERATARPSGRDRVERAAARPNGRDRVERAAARPNGRDRVAPTGGLRRACGHVGALTGAMGPPDVGDGLVPSRHRSACPAGDHKGRPYASDGMMTIAITTSIRSPISIRA